MLDFFSGRTAGVESEWKVNGNLPEDWIAADGWAGPLLGNGLLCRRQLSRGHDNVGERRHGQGKKMNLI